MRSRESIAEVRGGKRHCDRPSGAYDAQSKIGTFSDSLMAEAGKQGWNVISMKKDWKAIFPDLK